jgi:hypothetical protein
MRLSSLTIILVADGPNGLTETKQETHPLTEAALLEAGTRLISGEPDSSGRRVVSLRASAP